MQQQQNPSRLDAIGGNPSRRGLVLAVVGLAWTAPLAPLVAASLPAPAFAASTNPSEQLTITEATYYWRYSVARNLWLFAPRITVRNTGTTPTRQLIVSVAFPPAFIGTRPDGSPFVYNTVRSPWGSRQYAPDTQGNGKVDWSRTAPADQLAAGAEATLGRWVPVDNPVCVGWKNQVLDATPLATAREGDGSSTSAPLAMTEVPQPTA